MSQFLADNRYTLIAIAVGIVGLWLSLSVLWERPDSRKRWKRTLIWGPFAPAIDEYLLKRGGFTKRETLGWVVVGVLMLLSLALVFTQER